MMTLSSKIKSFLNNFKKDQRGVTAIEYGLIGVAMAVIVGTAFASDGDLRKNLADAYTKISTSIADVNKAPSKTAGS